MQSNLEQLIQAAEALVQQDRWTEAERVWKRVHERAPENPKALYGLGFHAMRAGDLGGAKRLLESVTRSAPKDLLAWITLATVHRELGQAQDELTAIESALSVEPYCLPALLLKGAWLERNARLVEAATVFRNSLKVAPPASRWPPALQQQLQHASAFVADQVRRYSTYLSLQLQSSLSAIPEDRRELWSEALSIFSGRTKPFHSQSNQLHVPRLPAQPFFDRSFFPWLEELEAGTALIRAELEEVLRGPKGQFEPYIAYRPGDPVNQWAELNHSTRWSALHLWRGGAPVEENLVRFPLTANLIERLPMADIGGLCPNVLFSALAPRTRIPPHFGETNARLVGHLPLVVPQQCWLRVGAETRIWEPGRALVFDDTLEHEAANDSDDLRVVLIFDLWNPLLGAEERELVRAMAAAARSFTTAAQFVP